MTSTSSNRSSVVVCLPLRDRMEPETAYALEHHLGFEYELLTEVGLPVDVARNRLAQRAKDRGADFVVWIDSDMFWAPQCVEIMLATLDHADVVTAHFGPRLPFATAYAYRGGKELVQKVLVEGVDFRLGDLVPIDSGGFGLVVHRRALLERIGDNPFSVTEYPDDRNFYERVRAVGGRSVMHSALFVGHVEDEVVYIPGRRPGRIDNGSFVFIEDGRTDAEITAAYAHKVGQSARHYGPALAALHQRMKNRPEEPAA